MSIPTPRSAGERLAQLEATVQEHEETIAQLQEYTLALHKSSNALFLVAAILPELLNIHMPAVRAAEVRKFRNHLTLAQQQHIQRLDKLEPQES